jgi:hypothetical protein
LSICKKIYALDSSDPFAANAGRVLRRTHSGMADQAKVIAEGPPSAQCLTETRSLE